MYKSEAINNLKKNIKNLFKLTNMQSLMIDIYTIVCALIDNLPPAFIIDYRCKQMSVITGVN